MNQFKQIAYGFYTVILLIICMSASHAQKPSDIVEDPAVPRNQSEKTLMATGDAHQGRWVRTNDGKIQYIGSPKYRTDLPKAKSTSVPVKPTSHPLVASSDSTSSKSVSEKPSIWYTKGKTGILLQGKSDLQTSTVYELIEGNGNKLDFFSDVLTACPMGTYRVKTRYFDRAKDKSVYVENGTFTVQVRSGYTTHTVPPMGALEITVPSCSDVKMDALLAGMLAAGKTYTLTCRPGSHQVYFEMGGFERITLPNGQPSQIVDKVYKPEGFTALTISKPRVVGFKITIPIIAGKTTKFSDYVSTVVMSWKGKGLHANEWLITNFSIVRERDNTGQYRSPSDGPVSGGVSLIQLPDDIMLYLPPGKYTHEIRWANASQSESDTPLTKQHDTILLAAGARQSIALVCGQLSLVWSGYGNHSSLDKLSHNKRYVCTEPLKLDTI